MASTQLNEPELLDDLGSVDDLRAKAGTAALFLRSLANANRLVILCHLSQGECTVAELERELGIKQPSLSQRLADLREHGLVKTRRESRSIHYSLADGAVRVILPVLHAVFCEGEKQNGTALTS